MNPRHRDRIAFMRVVSGQFERGMDVQIARSGKKIRLSKPHTFMASERSIVDDAMPGDIVGLYDPGELRIGDTLSNGPKIEFLGIPPFCARTFCTRKPQGSNTTQTAAAGPPSALTRRFDSTVLSRRSRQS